MEQKKIRRKKVIRDSFLVLVSLLIAFFIYKNNYIELFLKNASEAHFVIGAFVAGMFFTSTFTVAIASSVLLLFAQSYNPFLIAVIGGFGAVLGNTIFFKFFRDDLVADFEYLEQYFPGKISKRVFHSKLVYWFTPIVAAILIASPLPDEIGLVMLGSIKFKYINFLFLSFVLHTFGILIITLAGRLLFI